MQSSNDAAVMDALTMLRKEECVSSMVQSANDAASKDARIMLSKEECALGMGQRSSTNDASVKDALI